MRLTNAGGDYVDLVDPYRVTGLDGLGRAPLAHQLQQGPYQDGASRLGGKLQARVITIGIAQVAASETAAWTAWDNLLKVLQDYDGSATLRVTRSDASYRDLTVYYEAGLGMPLEAANTHKLWRHALQLVAFDPLFTGDLVTVSLNVNATTNITYAGTHESLPLIYIVGPAVAVNVTSNTTSEKVALSGLSIADGEVVIIDCRYGYKTVTSDINGNLIAYLTSDSDLATFHLAANPEVDGGVNVITTTVVGAITSLSLKYYPRYLSA
ncbi:MAG TPA: phage tail family protein [Verrucomicrobiota bacterium]|nr:phage tail family protein [Verrucomicrobiota bacterium]